jgi:predicted site-specific integrase-resolvase
MKDKKDEEEIKLSEAARSLGLEIDTLRVWCNNGKAKGRKKWGTRWVLTVKEVERLRKLA